MNIRYLFLILQALSFLTPLPAFSKTEISFIVPSGATSSLGRFFSQLSRDFEAEHKDVKINYMPKGSYNSALDLVLSNSQKSRGVVIIEISELLTMKDNKSIIPLDQFFSKNEKKEYLAKFIPGFLENSYDDKGILYGMPLMRSTTMIFYNADHLKSIGVSRKNLPETWDQLAAMLAKLKEKNNRAPLLLASDWYDWFFESFVGQAGGRLSNKNNTRVILSSDAAVTALKYWSGLMKKGLMVKNIGSWKSTLKKFIDGKTSVIFYSSGGLNDLDSSKSLNWLTSIMPKKKQFSVPVGATNIFVTNGLSKAQQKYAIEFVKFFSRPSIQAKIAVNTGYFPVTDEAFSHPLLKPKFTKSNFKVAKTQLQYSHAKIMFRKNNDVRVIIKNAIDAVLESNVSAEQALTEAQKKADKLLGYSR